MENPAIIELRRGRDDGTGVEKDACHPAVVQVVEAKSLLGRAAEPLLNGVREGGVWLEFW